MMRKVGGPTSVILLVTMLAVAMLIGAMPVMATEIAQIGDDLEEDPDSVLIRVELHEDGSATWTVSYRIQLDTDEEIEAFDELLDEIEANPGNFTTRFEDRMEPTVENAASATGRSMEMGEVTIHAERRFVDREYGIVEYRFNWTNFAVAEGDELHAGDALSGMFLTEETSLEFRWPEGYALVDASPSPDATGDRSARWSGPRDFTADEPRLAVSTDDPAGGMSLWMLAAIALAVVLGVGGAGYYVLVRGRPPSELAGESTPSTDSEDDELLSNEERVLRLVEANDGRMKQQAIADELDWTDAKTSKVVRTLRDEGKLEGFRLGRENVLRLPDVDEEGAGEP